MPSVLRLKLQRKMPFVGNPLRNPMNGNFYLHYYLNTPSFRDVRGRLLRIKANHFLHHHYHRLKESCFL